LFIGRCTYIDNNLSIYGLNGELSIGRFCSIAGKLILIGGDGYHKKERASTYPFPLRRPFNNYFLKDDFYNGSSSNNCKTIIGNDVWIGADVLITKNITVGNGAIIAAKSVVTKDIPPYAIVAGNPAKLLKYRFEKEKIEILEKINWWQWPLDKIINNSDLFQLTNNKLMERLRSLNSIKEVK